MKVPVSQVHPDDYEGAVIGDQVELDLLRGRSVRMMVVAACVALGTTKASLAIMIKLGIVFRGERLPARGGHPGYWIIIDPSWTRRDLYNAYIERAAVPRHHRDFDNYIRVRDMCQIPAEELPPAKIVEGMIPKLLEIGSSDPLEISAFTPYSGQSAQALQLLVNQGAAAKLSRELLPETVRPNAAMILEVVPALTNAPGTVFDRVLGGADLSGPKDNALRLAWALGPVRPAALLWSHLAAASGRTPVAVRAGVRWLCLLDRALTQFGGSPYDAKDISIALEAIAFGDEFAMMKPQARAMAARMIQLMLRQLRMYASRNDPTGSRGIAEIIPAQHQDSRGFAARVRAQYIEFDVIGGEARKVRSDRAADRYAEILDIAQLRLEQITTTQEMAFGATEELRRLLNAAASETASSGAPIFVEFGVLTTVLTPNGKLLLGSQICWWRAWRERDLWLDLAKRKQKVTAREDNPLYYRLKEIESDPEAYSDIVFEWRGCRPEHGKTAVEPWFVTISNLGVLSAPATQTVRERRRRHQLIVTWNLPAYGPSTAGLLNFDRKSSLLCKYASRRNRFVVPLHQFAFAMRFAHLGLSAVDETMCRISELLQMRQDREMWPTSGETGSEEVSFVAFPKGGRFSPANDLVSFQVNQETFVDATKLAADIARHDGHPDGVLPEIDATYSLQGKYTSPQAWIFQAGGRAVSGVSMNRFLAFLLGNVVDITFHEGRHASANAARQAGMPEESVQCLLNHRTVRHSRWYMRATERQRSRKERERVSRLKGRSAIHRATRTVKKGVAR